MAATNRPQKPTKLKVLHGQDKAAPECINDDEPIPPAVPVDKPTDLTDRQGDIWDRVTSDLAGMGLLARADVGLLRQYVIAEERAERAGVEFSAQPLTVRNPVNGAPMNNPMADQWLKLAAKVESLSRHFGLSPSARAGIRKTAAGATPESEPRTPDRLFG